MYDKLAFCCFCFSSCHTVSISTFHFLQLTGYRCASCGSNNPVRNNNNAVPLILLWRCMFASLSHCIGVCSFKTAPSNTFALPYPTRIHSSVGVTHNSTFQCSHQLLIFVAICLMWNRCKKQTNKNMLSLFSFLGYWYCQAVDVLKLKVNAIL